MSEPRHHLPCLNLGADLGGITEREARLMEALLDAIIARWPDHLTRNALWSLSMEIDRELTQALDGDVSRKVVVE